MGGGRSMLAIALIPMAAMIIGAAFPMYLTPDPRVTSALQHLAAGVVLAAATGELQPELMHQDRLLPILIGGGLGIAVTMSFKLLDAYYGEASSFMLAIALDLLVDGMIIGLGFVAGTEQGALMTFALTLEILFLGLALSATLAPLYSAPAIMFFSVVIGSMLIFGMGLGLTAATWPPALLTGGYAFGLIALLYLVTEELLAEAREHPQNHTPVGTALFFLGFLFIIMLEHRIQHG